MNRDTLIAYLTDWRDRQLDCGLQLYKLVELTGACPKSPLIGSIRNLSDLSTKLLAKLVGDDDTWLSWYQFECMMGAKPKTVQLNDGRQIDVATLEQLADVILDGRDDAEEKP